MQAQVRPNYTSRISADRRVILGIGLMIATALEHNGAIVYIASRRLKTLQEAATANNVFFILYSPSFNHHIPLLETW